MNSQVDDYEHTSGICPNTDVTATSSKFLSIFKPFYGDTSDFLYTVAS